MSAILDGDVVVVTGGAGGLGSAYCRLLAARGARVVVNDTGGVVDGRGGNPDAATEAASRLTETGGIAVGDDNDGSSVEGAQAIIQTALDNFGRIDAVVANAGILRDRTFLKMTDDDFFAVINAHLVGTTRIFHAAMPHMKAQGYGRLVATTSASGLFGNFGQANYAAAKMGIVGLSQVLAIEGAKAGILTNVVGPMAATRMTEGLMDADSVAKMPADSVAPLVAYLVSRECNLNGRVFSVGGGRIARVDVGVTRGESTKDMDFDWVADNINAIDSDESYIFPVDAAAEAALLPQ